MDILSKKTFTEEELSMLDANFAKNLDATLSELDAREIIRAINLIKKEFAHSLFGEALESYLISESLCARELINDENLDTYVKYYDISNALNYDFSYLALALGDFYYNEGDTEKAKAYYQEAFKPGFDLTKYGYFYSLERYTELCEWEKRELLASLISASEKRGGEVDL